MSLKKEDLIKDATKLINENIELVTTIENKIDVDLEKGKLVINLTDLPDGVTGESITKTLKFLNDLQKAALIANNNVLIKDFINSNSNISVSNYEIKVDNVPVLKGYGGVFIEPNIRYSGICDDEISVYPNVVGGNTLSNFTTSVDFEFLQTINAYFKEVTYQNSKEIGITKVKDPMSNIDDSPY